MRPTRLAGDQTSAYRIIACTIAITRGRFAEQDRRGLDAGFGRLLAVDHRHMVS
jgi:hypothetical protein